MSSLEESISDDYYIDKSKKIIKYKPEINLVLIPYAESVWRARFSMPPNPRDLARLQLTSVGIYSITVPYMVDALVRAIKIGCESTGLQYNNLIATETHAGVGGISLKLAKDMSFVNLVEITPMHIKVIKNNLDVFRIEEKKYKLIQDDYLNVFDKLEQDIIISDPPWGGVKYYEEKALRLGVDNIDIVYFINKLYNKKKFKLFVLFAPENYDMDWFKENIIPQNYIIYKPITKHFFIIILGPQYKNINQR